MQRSDIRKIYKKYISVKQLDRTKWNEKFFFNIFLNKNIFFLSSYRSSHGYLIFRKILDEYEILALATNIKNFRKGIASKLLKRLIEKAKKEDINKVFLEVSENNIAAIKLYLKMGFCKLGCRKNYYKTPEGFQNAFIMVLKI
tara:strand:+ start:205 stop:633 length:429 start_codon:yes stop_codon:yes gene_type:complete